MVTCTCDECGHEVKVFTCADCVEARIQSAEKYAAEAAYKEGRADCGHEYVQS